MGDRRPCGILMTVLAGRGVFCRIVPMTFRPDNQMAFGAIFSDLMMIKRPSSKGESMAICAVLTKPIGYMILGARILIKMATHTGRCRISVYTISVTVLALRRTMLSDQWIACFTVIELGWVPCLFTVALRAVDAAELVKVRIDVTLIVVSVRPFILPFCLVTTGAGDVIMHPLQFKARLLLMVEFPREPVRLGMAGTTFFLELPFVNILMAINTFFSLGLIPFFQMTLLTFRCFVFPDEWKFRLLVVVEGIFFPVRRVMAFLTVIAQLLFVGIVLFMTIKAAIRQGLVFPFDVALLTSRF